MPIRVECECGKRFIAKDEHAGKKGKCAECGRTLLVPSLQSGHEPTVLRQASKDASTGSPSHPENALDVKCMAGVGKGISYVLYAALVWALGLLLALLSMVLGGVTDNPSIVNIGFIVFLFCFIPIGGIIGIIGSLYCLKVPEVTDCKKTMSAAVVCEICSLIFFVLGCILLKPAFPISLFFFFLTWPLLIAYILLFVFFGIKLSKYLGKTALVNRAQGVQKRILIFTGLFFSSIVFSAYGKTVGFQGGLGTWIAILVLLFTIATGVASVFAFLFLLQHLRKEIGSLNTN